MLTCSARWVSKGNAARPQQLRQRGTFAGHRSRPFESSVAGAREDCQRQSVNAAAIADRARDRPARQQQRRHTGGHLLHRVVRHHLPVLLGAMRCRPIQGIPRCRAGLSCLAVALQARAPLLAIDFPADTIAGIRRFLPVYESRDHEFNSAPYTGTSARFNRSRHARPSRPRTGRLGPAKRAQLECGHRTFIDANDAASRASATRQTGCRGCRNTRQDHRGYPLAIFSGLLFGGQLDHAARRRRFRSANSMSGGNARDQYGGTKFPLFAIRRRARGTCSAPLLKASS